MQSDHQPPNRSTSRTGRFWHTLTTSSAPLRDRNTAEEVRFLALSLAILALFGAVVVIAIALFKNPATLPHNRHIWLLAGTTLWFALLYRTFNANRQDITIRLIALSSSLFVFAFAYFRPDDALIEPRVYLIIPVLISSIFLPVHETLLLISLNALGMVAFPQIEASVTWGYDEILPFTMTSILVMLAVHYLVALEFAPATGADSAPSHTTTILDMFSDVVFHVNAESVFLDYRANKESALYSPPETFLGKTISEVLPPDTAVKIWDSLRQTINTRRPHIVTYSLKLGADLRWYEAHSIPYPGNTVLAIVRDVTAVQHSIRALESSQKAYNALMHAMPDVIFRLTKTGDILNLSPNTAERLHIAAIQPGDNLREKLPQVADQVLDGIQRALQQNALQVLELRLPLDDAPHLYEMRLAPGGSNDVIAIVRDVTEQRHSQAQLRESEARYRALFDNSPISLWEEDFSAVKDYIDALRANGVTDLASYFFQHPEAVRHCVTLIKVLNVNQPTRDMLDIDIESTLLNTIDPMSNPQWQQNFSREIVAFSRGIHRFDSEIMTIDKDDQKRYMSLTSVIAAGYEDTWERVYVSIADVTGRVTAEEALATSESQLELALDGAELGLWDWNLRTNALTVNTWWAQMIGYTVDEIAPHISSWDNAIHPDDRERVWAAFHAHQDRLTPNYEVEYRLQAKDNSWVWSLDRGKIVERDQNGKALRMVGTHLDVTHRKQAEVAERDQRALTEALHDIATVLTSTLDLNEVLDHILTSISHVVPYDAASIALIEGDTARVVRSQGFIDENDPHAIDDLRMPISDYTTLKHMIAVRQPLIIHDTDTDPQWVPLSVTKQMRSYIGAPICWNDETVGFLGVQSRATNFYTRTQGERLYAFATQAAIAIQNARLFDAEYQQRVLTETLSHTVAVINSTLNLDEILHSLLRAVERVIPYEAANILLIEGQYAYVADHRGYDAHGTSSYMDALKIDITSWDTINYLITNSSGYVIADTATDPKWTYSELSDWIQSQLSVPIRIEDRVIGALNLDSAKRNAFAASDIARVQAFADQTALAINNARLYSELRSHRDQLEQRVQERTRDLSVRNAIAETLSSSLDTAEMLDGVLRVVTSQLHIAGSAIYLPDNPHRTQVLVTSHGIKPDMLNAVVLLPEDDTPVWNNPSDTFARHGDIPAMLSVPIWQKEQVEGAIVLVHDAPRTWTNSEKRMLDAIGRQIGVALANARSYSSAVQGEARIRTILESVADGLMVFDKTDQLLLLNPAAREMFNFYDNEHGGAKRAASLLWRWLRAYKIEYPNRARIEFALPATPLNTSDADKIRSTCEFKPCRLPHNPKKGWPCWLYPHNMRPEESKWCALYNQTRQLAIQAQTATVRDESTGEILGTVIVLSDVTHFRELDELKGRFVSTVSHELRTPLSTILLQVSMLLKYYDRFNHDERLTMIQEIQEQSQVLRKLIEDILELSRFDDNRTMPQKQWFDLTTACQDVLNSMELNIREKAITIDNSSCAGSYYIMADPNQIKRVMRNLVNNATKYTPTGGSITVSLKRNDSQVLLSVTDTGIGIDTEDIDYIFDRFYRAKDAINMASGTGLGLAITKEIVDLHDGHITVDSHPGEGSTFTVHLPVGGSDPIQ